MSAKIEARAVNGGHLVRGVSATYCNGKCYVKREFGKPYFVEVIKETVIEFAGRKMRAPA